MFPTVNGLQTADPQQFIAAESTPAASATYEALNPDGKRRAVSGRIRSEDQILNSTRRDRLAGNAMDLHRNAVLFAWAVRRHLDYTTLFDFQPCNADEGLNNDLRALMERDSRPENCDIGGRHSWNRMRRLAEVRKILDGDCGLLQLRSGHLQGVESNAIRTPRQKRRDAKQWTNGVKVGPGRRALAYGLTERQKDGELKERVVRASQMMLLACFEGRFDQVRGISPIAGALNEFRDIYETKDLIQSKVKLDQIFGVAFTREAGADDLGDDLALNGADDDGQLPADAEHGRAGYEIGQGVRGFDLDSGEGVELLQSKNPSSQTQDFLQLSILLAIKCLDLPYDLLDSSKSTYSGNRSGWLHYERAAVTKREDQLELHRRYTLFRLRRWMLPTSFSGTGELVLPSSMAMDDLRWKWVPRGIPWWKPQEELTTDLMAAAAGLKDFQQICDERGLGIWRDNVATIAAQMKQAQADGISLMFNNNKLPLSLSFDADLPAEANA